MHVRLNPEQFLGAEAEFSDFEKAAVAILPVPYEGGVSYGKGTAGGPRAVIEASQQLELYDEDLGTEPYRVGIATLAPPPIPSDDPAGMLEIVYSSSRELISKGKFVVLLGGDHSISSGYARVLQEKYGHLSVIQLDAHSDLRDTYEGSAFSHACVMSRLRELTTDTLQIGVRSMCQQEATRVIQEQLALCTMSEYRSGGFDIDAALAQLPGPVFLTLDVDVLDWSVVCSTGTPEPGGLLWGEALELLRKIFREKDVVGFDVVELSPGERDVNSPFAVAKLIYKMLGFKLETLVRRGLMDWPQRPRGPLPS